MNSKTALYAGVIALIIMILQPIPASAANSSLTEREAKTLGESIFTDIIDRGGCIVMYYNSDAPDATTPYGMTSMALADRFMRSMIAIKDTAVLSVKFYKVDWKNFSKHAIARIATDVSSVFFKNPESPSFAAYARSGKVEFHVLGTPRPDMQAWYTNEIMDDFLPSIPSDGAEYLRIGWTITDTSAKYISLADMRRENRNLNGKDETVRVVVSRSIPYDGFSCEYEQLYLWNGNLAGSIERCGKYGTTGYFDYDGNGKLQYRVKYKRNGVTDVRTAPSPTLR